MDLATDARRAMPALKGLLLGHQDALHTFDLSLAAFWRVFWLAAGAIVTGEIAFAALTSREGIEVAYQGLLVGLSLIGGSAAAVQILMVMGALEEWDHRILRFLIPVLWTAVTLWSVILVWRVAAFGLDLSGWADWWPRVLMCSIALYTVWQAARFGLRLSRVEAAGVLVAYACAEFIGFVIVNASILLVAR